MGGASLFVHGNPCSGERARRWSNLCTGWMKGGTVNEPEQGREMIAAPSATWCSQSSSSTCAYIHAHTHAYTHACMNAYTYIHACMHTHTYTHAYIHTHTHIHTYMHMHMHTCAVHMHIRIRIRYTCVFEHRFFGSFYVQYVSILLFCLARDICFETESSNFCLFFYPWSESDSGGCIIPLWFGFMVRNMN
jgi:hypothetical protein